ncbi:MAG: carboxypeptidase-like regulatory domain-containing protein [Thermomicrobiales bacterium]
MNDTASFQNVAIGAWYYTVQNAGFFTSGTVLVSAGETTAIAIDYVAPGTVHFHVTGTGFTDASVCVGDYGCAEVVDGEATVDNIPVGATYYTVHATPIGSGIYSTRGEVSVLSGQTVSVDVELTAQPAGTLIFSIPGSPSDLKVCIYGPDSFCDTVSSDQVTFTNIPAARWYWVASSATTGFQATGYASVTSGETTTVPITYVEPGQVTFILNGYDGDGAYAVLNGGASGGPLVDGQGTFKIPAGTYDYTVSTPGFWSSGTVTVVSGQITTVTVDYVEPGGIAFILDGYTGDEAGVYVPEVGWTSLVNGQVTISPLEAATYTYTVTAPGFQTTGTVAVTSGQTTTVTITYQSPQRVTFVFDDPGISSAEVCIEANYFSCKGFVDGSAAFADVSVGTWPYSVQWSTAAAGTVSAADSFSRTGTFTVIAGQPTTVDLSLSPIVPTPTPTGVWRSITKSVDNANPAPGSTVHLTTTLIGKDGIAPSPRYVNEQLPPGISAFLGDPVCAATVGACGPATPNTISGVNITISQDASAFSVTITSAIVVPNTPGVTYTMQACTKLTSSMTGFSDCATASFTVAGESNVTPTVPSQATSTPASGNPNGGGGDHSGSGQGTMAPVTGLPTTGTGDAHSTSPGIWLLLVGGALLMAGTGILIAAPGRRHRRRSVDRA